MFFFGLYVGPHHSVIFLECHPVVERWNCMLMDYFYFFIFFSTKQLISPVLLYICKQ